MEIGYARVFVALDSENRRIIEAKLKERGIVSLILDWPAASNPNAKAYLFRGKDGSYFERKVVGAENIKTALTE